MTTALLTASELAPYPIEDATRREFLAGLAAAGLLAGCGTNTTPVPTAPSTRPVEHLAGTTEVPVAPQRVAALDDIISVYLVQLGLPPAGAGDQLDQFLTDVAELVPPGTDTTAVTTIMADTEPNLEATAALGSDLILGTENHEDIFPQLTGISPTVLVERGPNGNWRPRFREVAAVIGRTERATEIERAYEQVIAALPDAVRDISVAFVRPFEDSQFLLDSFPVGFAGSVAADAGIPTLQPPGGPSEVALEDGYETLSNERLGIIAEADLIVVPDFRTQGQDTDSLTRFAANPLWADLPAVQSGRILQLPVFVYNGGNHYAAQLLLRAIAEALG